MHVQGTPNNFIDDKLSLKEKLCRPLFHFRSTLQKLHCDRSQNVLLSTFFQPKQE
jgi:hypothetical protein